MAETKLTFKLPARAIFHGTKADGTVVNVKDGETVTAELDSAGRFVEQVWHDAVKAGLTDFAEVLLDTVEHAVEKD